MESFHELSLNSESSVRTLLSGENKTAFVRDQGKVQHCYRNMKQREINTDRLN